MESYIPISYLNDFLFCPRSIYFHQLYGRSDTRLYQETAQVEGRAAHSSIEESRYSTRSRVLQGIEIYCEKYNLCGKLDIFYVDEALLCERKREIKEIYDGYIFQVYAQYFALTEMGYTVNRIVLHDFVHNRRHMIALPQENPQMLEKFEKLVAQINSYDLDRTPFVANANKCARCIYRQLCDYNLA
jgi:CRISPR-associated protein Cas4